jgi:hypothetical protein
MKLNLGCGRNPLDGFVNLDRQPDQNLITKPQVIFRQIGE